MPQIQRATLVLLLVVIFFLYLFISHITSRTTLENGSLSNEIQTKVLKRSKNQCFTGRGHHFSQNRLTFPNITNAEDETAYVSQQEAINQKALPRHYSNLTDFIVSTRQALLSRRLKHGMTMIPMIFRDPPFNDMIKPSCDGLWMEFGVWSGNTLNRAAKWKSIYCGNQSDPVYGFDTFTGLPTDWRPGFPRGAFQLEGGNIPKTLPNTELVKGLFIDTLPVHLRRMDTIHKCRTPVSFIHIDCDIYDGARDVLFMLSHRFVRGSIIVFDELYNYPGYEKHEIKAFYEFLVGSGIDVIPLGSPTEIRLNLTSDLVLQSFAFVVA